MRIGLITDTHSNPWGQEAVLKTLRAEGIPKKDTYDLGDNAGMFPEVIAAADLSIRECSLHLMGNHDAVLAGHFEDDPRRAERIGAIKENKKKIEDEGRLDLIRWFGSLPINYVYFTHNAVFGTRNPKDKEFMLARFGPTIVDPENQRYDSKITKLLEVSNFPQQVLVRGHAHTPSVHKIKRGLEKIVPGMVSERIMVKGEGLLEVMIDPEFTYIFTVGSACGANTMFTPDGQLDYRPSGAFIEYDLDSQTGKASLFRVNEGYDSKAFIRSVESNVAWENFEEAQKQINHLKI